MRKFSHINFFVNAILFSLIILSACGKINRPNQTKKYIPYKVKEPVGASICLWKNDKRAAYTIAFDDVRPSHYLISAPELYQRKMVGTFNLNTANVSDWNRWRTVAKQGHELASHTVHHVKLTALNDNSIRWELQKSKQMIETMVPENGPVLSFTNPYGMGDERVKSIVKQYYLSERDNWGINDSSMTPEQLYDVKGVGAYPPFDEAKLKEKLELTLKKRAWILVYFHTVTTNPDTTDICQCPLDFFIAHLNFVQSKRDSFWIATQRDVAKYILARTGAVAELQKINSFKIKIRIKNVVKMNLSDLIVSVRLKLPVEWVGNNLEICNKNGNITNLKNLPRYVILTFKLNQDYFLKGFKL